jgi:RND family efflux transporter MFP subunit
MGACLGDNRGLPEFPGVFQVIMFPARSTVVPALFALQIVFCSVAYGEAVTSGKPALTVSLISPQKADWTQRVAATGDVVAWQEAIIGAELPGQRLAEVSVEVGDQVRKGQLLARISEATALGDVAQAEAAVKEAQANLTEAQANAERARELREKGFYSQQQGSQYLTAEQGARARRDAARAVLDSARIRLSQMRITAPDDGVISASNAAVGTLTAPGQELFRLIRKGRLEWRAEVPEAQLASLRSGMSATLVTANGARVSGRVRMAAPVVDPKTRNGIVYVDLLKPGAEVRAGMFARGEIDVARSQALTLPQNAVVMREAYAYAFTVEKVGAGGTASVKANKLLLGRRQGDSVEVLSGLDASAQVIAGGGGFLADGDTVRLSPAAK